LAIVLIVLLLLIFIILGVLFTLGYRLTPAQAANAFFKIDVDAKLLVEDTFDWGTVYLFETNEGTQVVISERRDFLWVARVGFHMPKNDERLKMVGWASFEGNTIVYVSNKEPAVSRIDIDNAPFMRIHYSVDQEITMFKWEHPIEWYNIQGKAFSKNGEVVYEYGFDENANNFSGQSWLEVSD